MENKACKDCMECNHLVVNGGTCEGDEEGACCGFSHILSFTERFKNLCKAIKYKLYGE